MKHAKNMSHRQMRTGKLKIPLYILALNLNINQSFADEAYFNPDSLEISMPTAAKIDISQLSNLSEQLPGIYRVDIYINDNFIDSQDINFIEDDEKKLQPLLNLKQLKGWGVNVENTPMKDIKDETTSVSLSEYLPSVSSNFDFPRQRLNISIPQVLMKRNARNYIDQKYYDDGIPAVFTNYNFSGSNIRQDEKNNSNNYFLGLFSGANFGGWRFRNYSTWTYSHNDSNDEHNSEQQIKNNWDSINSYIQHDIPIILGRFVVGDYYSPSDIFDSVQFRGMQISSDDNMLPDSMRGFAPTISGIANSNAQVTIAQNNSIIYQTYVQPGAFIINDLYPTSSSGDLQVTIKEADGSTRTFLQPFSNVPIMQREGRLKYSATLGKYRSSNKFEDEPSFGQFSLIYGLPYSMTAYGGTQISEDYNAAALGIGLSLGDWGATSFDVTNAQTSWDEEKTWGQSYRIQYSKSIEATNSIVTLAAYRYSTEGFYTFQESQNKHDDEEKDIYRQNNKRSRLQINLTQNIMRGELGSLSFSGYQQDYWGTRDAERNFSLAYNNAWNSINWSIMYTYTTYADSSSKDDQQVAIFVSLPLGHWLPGSYMNNNITSDMKGQARVQTGLSGTLLEDRNLTYNLSQSYANKSEGNSGALSGDYRGTYGEVNAGYSYSDEIKQLNYGTQGSIIAHPYGITLGQSSPGDTFSIALVQASNTSGVKVQNGTGIRTDWRGYTVIPYLMPYKRARIALDPSTLSDNVELKQNVLTVVPTTGSIVLAKFKTSIGNRTLITLTNGKDIVPFGSVVTINEDIDTTGIVGEGGQVYLSGVPQQGHLSAKWGSGESNQCGADFSLPEKQNENEKRTNIYQFNLNCR